MHYQAQAQVHVLSLLEMLPSRPAPINAGGGKVAMLVQSLEVASPTKARSPQPPSRATDFAPRYDLMHNRFLAEGTDNGGTFILLVEFKSLKMAWSSKHNSIVIIMFSSARWLVKCNVFLWSKESHQCGGGAPWFRYLLRWAVHRSHVSITWSDIWIGIWKPHPFCRALNQKPQKRWSGVQEDLSGTGQISAKQKPGSRIETKRYMTLCGCCVV